MRHCDGGDTDVAAHHDDAASFVDDDLGGKVGIDLELLDLGEEGDDVALELRRDRKLHSRGIDRFGGLDAEIVVDRGRDPLGRGEVGVAQREPHVRQPIERKLDLAFDDGAVGDAADGRNAAHDLRRFALGLETGDRERALSDRVDVAVGAEQRRDQQGAAAQVLGVAQRGDGDVHARALGGEGRRDCP